MVKIRMLCQAGSKDFFCDVDGADFLCEARTHIVKNLPVSELVVLIHVRTASVSYCP
jgi:hypothetical protein